MEHFSSLSGDSHVVTSATNLNLEPNDSRRLAIFCGPLDQNIRHLEKRLGIRIKYRGNAFQLIGPKSLTDVGRAVVSQLYVETATRDHLDTRTLHLLLHESGIEQLLSGDLAGASMVIKTQKKTICPRSKHQREFVQKIQSNDINFGVGPAGTGKTYLAVACAVEALLHDSVGRILLVRPAVEVGEKLGFLPGDLAQKIDPYLRPLYDTLYEMLGVDRVNRYTERNIIETAPLAYMRGRTLNDAFVILDESQNTTISQMKMFLTRIGFGSKVAITGDVTQIDLPQQSQGQQSGLIHVLKLIRNISGISITYFDSKDVVRHCLVQKIVDAYDQGNEQRVQQISQVTNGCRN